MMICQKHGEELDKDIPEHLWYLVPEMAGILIFDVVDGDKFDYNWRLLNEAIDQKSAGCPFCFFGNEYYNLVVKTVKGERNDKEDKDKNVS